MIENRVGCILDQIEDIERMTGQKFDDEKLIKTLKERWTYDAYHKDICALDSAYTRSDRPERALFLLYPGRTDVDRPRGDAGALEDAEG